MSILVDWRQSVALTGTVIKYLAVAMLVPLGISLLDGDDTVVFLVSMVVAVTVGVALERVSDGHELEPREALLFVDLSWGAVAVIGTNPYVIAGYGTESARGQPVNALFESLSGFTTLPTGGFSPQAASIAAFSPAVQWVVIPFILIAGMSFALFYLLLQDDYAAFLQDRYLLALGAAAVLLLDAGRVGLELAVLEALSASLATLGNSGPGFGFLGPFESYLDFPDTSKLLMIFVMWIGRLEIIPVFVIFTGAFWNE